MTFDMDSRPQNHGIAVEDPEYMESFARAVNALSALHLEVLRLHIAGNSYSQIADITGVTVETVRSRIYHARLHLRNATAHLSQE